MGKGHEHLSVDDVMFLDWEWVFLMARVAMRKYHKLSGLNSRNLLCHGHGV